MMGRIIRYTLLCLGLVVGTPASQSVCMAMGGMMPDETGQTGGTTKSCHDVPAPQEEHPDPGSNCCDGSTMVGCFLTTGSCCSISEQALPVQQSVDVRVLTASLDLIPAYTGPPGLAIQRRPEISPPSPIESINRLALHSTFLI